MTSYKIEFISAWVADNKLGYYTFIRNSREGSHFNFRINDILICQTDLNDWESLDIGLKNNLPFCEDKIERIKALHYFEFGTYPKMRSALIEPNNATFNAVPNSFSAFKYEYKC